MTTTNVAVPQRIKSKSREELEHRILALEAANAKCGEAIDDAVAEAVAKETERCIMALENIDILGVNQRERSISEHTINSGAAAIRNGSAAK